MNEEQIIFQRFSALRVLHNYGIDEALRLYPEQRQFIEATKNRPRKEVTEELEEMLYKKKRLFVSDRPVTFGIGAMEKEAKGSDRASLTLQSAKEEADRRQLPYSRLRFYIGPFDGQYVYYIIEPRKKKNERRPKQ